MSLLKQINEQAHEMRMSHHLAATERFLRGDIDYEDLPDETREALYAAFWRAMPYGVAKARTGDPDQWILDQDESFILNGLRNYLETGEDVGP